MVMEQSQQQPPTVLSPQCVGREFVRQYYTLLNEAPAHLHRFYNNSSSFIHGEPDSNNRETVTVVGQRQIHQRIQELNFRDCHAKITQVDSQATLGNGVVVQVTGELSNNGQPMRRFTQTFVLASQNPKKYYVHNDIFRYQDVLTDDEEGDMARSDLAEEDQEQEVRQNEIRQNESTQSESTYYSPTVNGTADPIIEDVNLAPSDQHITQQQITSNNYNSLEMIQPPASQMGQNSGTVIVQTSNFTTAIKEEEHLEPQEPQKLQQVFHPTQVPPAQPSVVQQPQQPLGPSEPKTYATLVKTGNNMPGTNMYFSSSLPSAPPSVQPVVPQHSPPTALSPTPPVESKPAEIRHTQPPKPQRNDVGRSNYSPRVSMNSDDNGNYGGSGDAERRRTVQYSERSPSYPDLNQVFIGNVPVQASETELRDLFSKFGTVVDLKILSKTSMKSPSSRVPNYGFVIFEDQSSALAVLQSKHSITVPDGSGNSVKINVEEKKAKRGGEGGRPPRGGGGGGGGGGMIRGVPIGGSTRGPPEPRGSSRNGMRGGGFNGHPNRRT